MRKNLKKLYYTYEELEKVLGVRREVEIERVIEHAPGKVQIVISHPQFPQIRRNMISSVYDRDKEMVFEPKVSLDEDDLRRRFRNVLINAVSLLASDDSEGFINALITATLNSNVEAPVHPADEDDDWDDDDDDDDDEDLNQYQLIVHLTDSEHRRMFHLGRGRGMNQQQMSDRVRELLLKGLRS